MKKYLLAGLLTWLPITVTVWVVLWMVGLLDSLTDHLLNFAGFLLPANTAPSLQFLSKIPGLGIAVVALLLLLTGLVVTNVAGRWWVHQLNQLISRVPLVTSIYNGVKKVSQTLFSDQGKAFRKAVLVQFPHSQAWTIGFVTGSPNQQMHGHLQAMQPTATEFINVYVPTTPNPTSGYFLMLPKHQVVELEMGVDEALMYVISMGALTTADPVVIGQNPNQV